MEFDIGTLQITLNLSSYIQKDVFSDLWVTMDGAVFYQIESNEAIPGNLQLP